MDGHPNASNSDVADAEPFRLLVLPDEFWSRIGKLALDAEIEDPITTLKVLEARLYRSDPSARTLKDQCKPPAVAQVCRILRQEMLKYFFRCKVKIGISEGNRDIVRWLSVMNSEGRKRIALPIFVFGHTATVEIPEWFRVTLTQEFGIRYKIVGSDAPFERTEFLRKVRIEFD